MIDAIENNNEDYILFRMVEDKDESAWFGFDPQGLEPPVAGTPFGLYHITTDDFSGLMYDNTEVRWRPIKRFDRIRSVLKSLASKTKSFYGNAYPEEIKQEHFKMFVKEGKARFPFDLTFWGMDYPARPNNEAQEKLKELGYKIENTDAGTWLWIPVEFWHSDNFKIDHEKVKKILGFDEEECYSSIYVRPGEK